VSIDAEPKPRGFLAKLKKRLNRGTAWLGSGVASAFGRNIDESTLAELEDELLLADAGIEATESLIAELRSKARRADSKDRPLADLLRECVAEALLPLEQPLLIEKSDSPRVILVVGVNGTGKTTTIGKLAQRLRSQGFSVLLAAGDTFRAAAVEQLQQWAHDYQPGRRRGPGRGRTRRAGGREEPWHRCGAGRHRRQTPYRWRTDG
jgi:fused signal recognition particle receptor